MSSWHKGHKLIVTAVEKSFCVLLFNKTGCPTLVQRRFETHFKKKAPARQSIRKWHKWFENMGCVCKSRTGSGRPSTRE